MKCFWPSGCANSERCREFGSCVAAYQNKHKDEIFNPRPGVEGELLPCHVCNGSGSVLVGFSCFGFDGNAPEFDRCDNCSGSGKVSHTRPTDQGELSEIDRIRYAAAQHGAFKAPQGELVDIDWLVLVMLKELHANVPADKQPMGMCDLSDDQAKRAKAAVRAVIAALEYMAHQMITKGREDEIQN